MDCLWCVVGFLVIAGLVWGYNYLLSIVENPRTWKQRLTVLESHVNYFDWLQRRIMNPVKQDEELRYVASLIMELLPEGFGVFVEGGIVFHTRDPKGALIDVKGVRAYIQNARGKRH